MAHRSTAAFTLATLVPLASLLAGAPAQAQSLPSFAVLAGSTVTNTGATVINGNLGVSPGTAVVGFFAPGIVTAPYAIYRNDAVAIQAQIDLVTQYNDLAGRPTTVNLTGQDLGGQVLGAGVYSYDAAAQLTGTLTLDARGNPNAVFIINVGSALTTASSSSVALINGARGSNVFFVVGSSATLGTDTAFAGGILALTSITLNTGADINCGAALARNGAVTLDTNTISICQLAPATIGTVVAPVTTPTVAAVAGALDAFVAGGGDLPLGAFLTPEQLAAVLAQLSGELGTAVAPAVGQAMTGFMNQIFSHLDETRGPFPQGPQAMPLRGTVRALGYADQTGVQSAALSSVDQALSGPTSDPRLWNAWAAAYGDHTETDGSRSGGTTDRSIHTFGIAAGIDYRISPDTRIGFAIGGGGTDFGLADGFGDGDSEHIQAALYGQTEFDAAYVAGALAYSWSDVSTERTLTTVGGDRLTSDFSAHDFSGRVEGGYRFALPDLSGTQGAAWVAPYAAVQVQAIHTPSYGEDSDSGTSLFALDYDSRTAVAVRTELGLKAAQSFLLGDADTLTLRTRLAWAHDEWSNEEVDASFASLADSDFTVRGADDEHDAVLVSAGAEVRLDNGFSVAAIFDSALAEDSQTYSGTARLSYVW
jgi:uncharacterized protein with beta-barrel porin domain